MCPFSDVHVNFGLLVHLNYDSKFRFFKMLKEEDWWRKYRWLKENIRSAGFGPGSTYHLKRLLDWLGCFWGVNIGWGVLIRFIRQVQMKVKRVRFYSRTLWLVIFRLMKNIFLFGGDRSMWIDDFTDWWLRTFVCFPTSRITSSDSYASSTISAVPIATV